MKSFHFHTLATFLYASFALGDYVFFFTSTPEDIEKKEHEIVSHEYESGFFRKGTCSTPIFTSKKENEIDSKDIPTPVLSLSGLTECQGETVLEHSHVREGTSEKPSAGDVAHVVNNGNAVEVVTPSNKMIVHKDGSVERWNKESGKWEPYSSENGSADDIENMINVLEGNWKGNGHGKGLFKEALEAMSKCNIETKGAADEANKVCVTKKLKEELKNKTAEKKLPGQQQLAAQPKKSNAQQTNLNKKSNQVSTKKSKQTQSTQSKKTTKNTTQPNNPAQTVSIDFSRLNSLISQQVSFMRGILSSGEKATSAQNAQFNSLNNQYVSEFNRLKAQITTISDPTKKSQYYSQLASINSRISSELDPLLAQGESRELFVNL